MTANELQVILDNRIGRLAKRQTELRRTVSEANLRLGEVKADIDFLRDFKTKLNRPDFWTCGWKPIIDALASAKETEVEQKGKA